MPVTTKEDLQKYAVRVLPLVCDVTNKEAVQKAIKKCNKELGLVDIMIANAGISISSPGCKLDSKIYEETYNINVLGALYCFEMVIPDMLKRRNGQLVSISSLASYRGLPEAGAYSSSKAALSAITESLRLDLKKYNIDVKLKITNTVNYIFADKNRLNQILLNLLSNAIKVRQHIGKPNLVYPQRLQ